MMKGVDKKFTQHQLKKFCLVLGRTHIDKRNSKTRVIWTFLALTFLEESFRVVNNTVKQIQTRSFALSVVLTPVKSWTTVMRTEWSCLYSWCHDLRLFTVPSQILAEFTSKRRLLLRHSHRLWKKIRVYLKFTWQYTVSDNYFQTKEKLLLFKEWSQRYCITNPATLLHDETCGFCCSFVCFSSSIIYWTDYKVFSY